jgi:hypothetical protein
VVRVMFAEVGINRLRSKEEVRVGQAFQPEGN